MINKKKAEFYNSALIDCYFKKPIPTYSVSICALPDFAIISFAMPSGAGE